MQHFKQYWFWYLIAVIVFIAAIVIYFNWDALFGSVSSAGEDNPTADGKPCTLSSGSQRNKQGIYKNGICVPLPTDRLTAIQANNIVNNYAVKDSNGYATISFNGSFDFPNLSKFPVQALQNLLQNGWWLSLLKGGTLNGYKAGSNGSYLVSVYDLRDATASINNGKTQVAVPPSLQPYINI